MHACVQVSICICMRECICKWSLAPSILIFTLVSVYVCQRKNETEYMCMCMVWRDKELVCVCSFACAHRVCDSFHEVRQLSLESKE